MARVYIKGKKTQVHTYLLPETVEQIKSVAEARKWSLAQWLRWAAETQLEQEKLSGTVSKRN